MIQARSPIQPNSALIRSWAQLWLAFARPMWMRHRTDFIRAAIWCLLGILGEFALSFDHSGDPFMGSLLKFVIAGIVFFRCISFAIKIEGSVSGNFGSGFSTAPLQSLFALPLTTRAMVLGPMVPACLSVLTLWFAFCVVTILPLRLDLPVLMPALALLMSVVCSQAGRWIMHSRVYAGILVSTGGSLFLFAAIFLIGILHWPQVSFEVSGVAIVIASVWGALQAAPLARRSDPSAGIQRMAEKARANELKTTAKYEDKLFASPLEALVWFRMRRLPKTARMPELMYVGFLLLMILFFDHAPRVALPIGDIHVPVALMFLSFALILPMALPALLDSMLDSMGGIKDGKLTRSKTMATFLAVRPAPTLTIFKSKFIKCLRDSLRIWPCLFLCGIPCLFLPAKDGRASGSFGELLLHHVTARGIGLTALSVACLPGIAVCVGLTVLFVQMLPTRLTKYATGVGGILLVFVSVFFALTFILPLIEGRHHNSDSRLHTLIIVGVVLLGLKCLLAGRAYWSLRQADLVPASARRTGVVAWFVTALVLISLFYFSLPAAMASLPGLALIVALVLPANRILWHIVLLDQSRHI